MNQTLEIFRALADDVRLRVVSALMEAELSVAELVHVLGLPQSTVSRHLKPLRDAGFVETRREGTSIYYRRGRLLSDPTMTAMLSTHLSQMSTGKADSAAIRRVLDQRRKRSRDFFDRMAGRYSSLTQPGGGWEALSHGLAAGFAGRDVVDIGSGEGELTLLLARFARRVVAVDHSSKMRGEVLRRAKKAGLEDRVSVAEGDLGALPLEAESVDVAVMSQALHHAAQPEQAIREAARVLRTGGLLLVLDLARHEHDWMREKWADQWLGFEEQEMEAWMRAAGLNLLAAERVSGAAPDLPVLLNVAIKP